MNWPTDRLRPARVAPGALAVFLVLSFVITPGAVTAQSDNFEISDLEPGETTVQEDALIEISANVTNNADVRDEKTVEFRIDNETRATREVELASDNSTRVSAEIDIDAADLSPGEYEYGVFSNSSESTATLTIEESVAGFEITDLDPDEQTIQQGETLTVSANVTNEGEENATKDVELFIDDSSVENETVTLEPDETDLVEFRNVDTANRSSGEYDYSVRTDDAKASGSLTIEAVGDEKEEKEEEVDPSPFSVERTTHEVMRVRLDASEVGENASVPAEEVTIVSDPGDLEWSWNLSEDPKNGVYEGTFPVPGPSDGVSNVSLDNATVSIDETEFEATVHLHSVETAFAGWIDESTLYLPVGTVGVTESSRDTVEFVRAGGDEVPIEFEDPHTVAIDHGDLPETNGTVLDGGFETGGDPLGPGTDVKPDIRFFHGDLVVWHPDIENGAEYTVEIHEVDGNRVNRSVEDTAIRPGMVPVPDAGTVAGADTVTVSVKGSTVLDNYTIESVSTAGSLEAELIDSETVQFERSMDQLSVSAVFINKSDPAYLTDGEVVVDGQELQLSGADLSVEHSLELATDAGIVAVTLSQPSGEGGLQVSSLVPLVWFVLAGLLGIGLGFFVGGRVGLPDSNLPYLVVFVVAVIILAAILLVSLFGSIDLTDRPVEVDLVIVLVAAMSIGFAVGGIRKEKQTPDQRGRTGKKVRTVDTRVTITDGSRRLDGSAEVTATRSRDRKTRTSKISRGSGTLTLPEGRWKITAEHGGYESDTEPVNLKGGIGRGEVNLEIPLPDISVTVRDGKLDRPVPDATVRFDAAETTSPVSTDSEGQVTFDPPVEAETVTITAVHDKYEEATITRQLTQRGIRETIELRPKTGSVRFVSRIDGVATGNMELNVSPDEPALQQLFKKDRAVETTDKTGDFTLEPLLIGQYRASLNLPRRLESLFETRENRLTVTDGVETEVTLEASFTWDLSPAQRDRIRQIRTDLQDVTGKSGVDTAIPQYYASVIEGILDAVEAFPDRGHHFAEVDTHPDEVVSATLDATARAVETISDAMSTKRNLDLFTACADMAAARAQWEGTFQMEVLIDRLGDDGMTARRAFAARADEVSDRIDSERSGLSEVAPARELLERVDIESSGGDVESIVAVHVAILLVDAIDELFDHPELRERLSRTVF